jgi:asparagine synthase (glutamine-hydrolysing)
MQEDGTQIALGHRRLAIIDLETGQQPLGNEDGAIQIVFNGEIYNYQELRQELVQRGHRFRTNSDTETIVHAYEEYGESCVKKFRGMFAFALWDSARRRLFLARDRFGKKPLFLRQDGGRVAFASEIKAILRLPGVLPKVNEQAVWHYLAYRYVPGPDTLVKGVRKLMPGSYAVWEGGELTEHRYYTPPDGEPRTLMPPPAEAEGLFLSALDEAVRIRMVADVPYGAFLSGGIDSSAVVALMSRNSALPVKTFSVGFKEENYSELRYAREVARIFRTEHHELEVGEQQIMDYLPELIRFRDAPVSEPSDIPIFLLSREASRSVKMVLTGEGSDEILGGYPKHVFERFALAYQRIPGPVRRGLVEPLAGLLPYAFSRTKTAVFAMGLQDPTERMPRWFGALGPRERERLAAMHSPELSALPQPQFDWGAGVSSLRRVLFFDQVSWLPDNLLERGDRMTMAASLEARMPFLDQELAQFVSQLPDRFRVRGRVTKWILREAARTLIPKAILERPKVGFRVPVNEWFRGRLRGYLTDHLLGSDSRTRDYYRNAVLHEVVAEHLDGRQNHEKLLWMLLGLELWHRQCIG